MSSIPTPSLTRVCCVLSSEDLDVSGLSLHQAKRLEMESQVRVLELEANLQKERERLATLRRQHYRLAGELEGWEQQDIINST
uniref:I/LWEQ domain-containing protein n=1 Tax=Timema monikensis TaxID=170555 RepID=A0A7R9EFY8_9NEOP|nr:unnamed protein product [Timema monikensis]